MNFFAVQGLGVWIVAAWLTCVVASADDQPPLSRAAIDTDFRQRLEFLAKKCEELGLAEQARTTKQWFLDRDPGRQYLFVASARDESRGPAQASDLVQKWLARFLEHRRVQAAQLFDLAQQHARRGNSVTAYQMLHEVLHEDPSHAEARRILALGATDDQRPRSRPARLAHPQFGWPRGRWWQIDSPHFQIATDHSSEAGLELARQLEGFHAAWRQLFYSYWNTPEWLTEQFDGTAFQTPTGRKHQVVLFRDRAEYLERLVQPEPQITLTLGFYSKAHQTSYFYEDDNAHLPVWYHEATHQLFQETGTPIQDVGEKWNFWVVEGIAVYMESLVERDGYYTVGGFDADRLQFTRSRVLSGEPQMPLDQLVRLGREDLQRHPDIRRLYTQSAGLAHFLMDFDRGRHRDALVRFLSAVYLGRDTPETLFSIDGLSAVTIEEDWQTFLMVRENDLRYLGPPARRRNLSLLKGQISDSSLRLLASSDQLQWLDLSFTPITAAGLQYLTALKNLERLSLVGVKMNDSAAANLAGFPKLEELDLSGTAITDQALSQLASMPRLRVLRIAHTAVSDAGIAQLVGLKHLEELDVENTAVTNQGLKRLKQHLPKLK